jgi:hypothetical protein
VSAKDLKPFRVNDLRNTQSPRLLHLVDFPPNLVLASRAITGCSACNYSHQNSPFSTRQTWQSSPTIDGCLKLEVAAVALCVDKIFQATSALLNSSGEHLPDGNM